MVCCCCPLCALLPILLEPFVVDERDSLHSTADQSRAYLLHIYRGCQFSERQRCPRSPRFFDAVPHTPGLQFFRYILHSLYNQSIAAMDHALSRFHNSMLLVHSAPLIFSIVMGTYSTPPSTLISFIWTLFHLAVSALHVWAIGLVAAVTDKFSDMTKGLMSS